MKKFPGILLSGLLLCCAMSCDRTSTQNATANTQPIGSANSLASKPPASPAWAKNATIYEVNLRQFSSEGTFKALEQQLTRLKEMGVDVLWLMPIHPIGVEKRKGTLGNPYAVKDYQAVDPEYGTMEDFKALVKRAHDLDMRVLLDWVPNHTSWDHPWVKQHPDWYTQVNGRIISPLNEKGESAGWNDVADLNYDNEAMRHAMLDAMKFWVQQCDVDGFRCEVASLVPDEFWADVRPALDSIKTVFLLAESEDDPAHFKLGFNVNYGWSLHWLLKGIYKGTQNATAIDSLLAANQKRFPPWYYQVFFLQNQDENSWAGTATELFGNGADAFTVLAYTFDGMPLVYNGQEANLSKRLKMHEKDPIFWGNYSKQEFYKSLLTLKHRNKALWNGLHGGPLVKIPTGRDEKVYAFHRQKDGDHVAVIVNLSPEPQTIQLSGDGFEGMYTEVFSRQSVELRNALTFTLKPWEYKVYTN
ncbi:alpha-amylase family glycosyl hydrolase [Tellurirhabdus bombi]|uniref:alpha-amylase family glycosyl hydrolase n=1 Tax=Tellurirhabdus bombi TaxID=2907205 RepID=UPI001F2E0F3D|nr:alpha-amylase family glycosyl hydrolase [Tellurirhabdus bombi]